MIDLDITKFFPPGITEMDHIVSALLPDVVEAVRTRIVTLAQSELNQTAPDYLQGLQEPVYHYPSGKIPSGQAVVASIALVGQLPNMIEQGWAGGDMKPDLLRGPNARDTSTGRVNVVPFRHSTPGSNGKAGTPMGAAYAREGAMSEEDAARLGKRVHNTAKRLSATITHPGKATQWGDSLPAGMAPLLRPHHVTDIYAGMYREQKTYKKAKQSQYITFRMVSENSKPEAWIHPGIPAHNFLDRGAEEIDNIMPRLLQAALKGAAR